MFVPHVLNVDSTVGSMRRTNDFVLIQSLNEYCFAFVLFLNVRLVRLKSVKSSAALMPV